MLTQFKRAGRNRWDIRIDGRKKGRIGKRGKAFVAQMTRHVPHTALDGICAFLAELNAGRVG